MLICGIPVLSDAYDPTGDHHLTLSHPHPRPVPQLHVKWNNVHVPGSPFRLKIGKQDADPAAVHAHGKGLEKAHTGQKTDFIVDTCNAGSGTLLVTVDGPSKVTVALAEAMRDRERQWDT